MGRRSNSVMISRRSVLLCGSALAVIGACSTSGFNIDQPISTPGIYSGFSTPLADGFIRSSEYITVHDGCRIATDIYLPTLDGQVLDGPLPTLVMFTGYRRAWIMGEHEQDVVANGWPHHGVGEFASFVTKASKLPDNKTAEWLPDGQGLSLTERVAWLRKNGREPEFLLVHGYAIVVADTRGSGASFGTQATQSSITIGRDISDVMDTLAERDWCSGEFGMIGGSWLGAVQHMAATYGAPRLKATMPAVAPYDQYLSLWPGGVFNLGLMRDWLEQTSSQDSQSPSLAVDEDPEGTLRDAAIAARLPLENPDISPSEMADAQLAQMSHLPRDYFQLAQALSGRQLADGTQMDLATSPLDFDAANKSAIPTYELSGWWDIYAAEAPIIHENLKVPKKMLIGPWHHRLPFLGDESLRWFDYWLKGIENGIMDEPSLTYAVATTTEPMWHMADEFPRGKFAEFFLREGGALSTINTRNEDSLKFTTDPETTSGLDARGWGFARLPHLDYSPLQTPSPGRLFFTSAEIEDAFDLVGYPKLSITLSADQSQGQLYAYLLAIAESGDAHFLSEGWLDLKFRATETAPISFLDRPYRTFRSTASVSLTPYQSERIDIDMTPTGWRVMPGQKLVLILQGADKDNAYRAGATPLTTYDVTLGGENAPILSLPMLNTNKMAKMDAFSGLSEENYRAVSPFRWEG